MFKLVGCNEKTFYRVTRFAKLADRNFSQDTYTMFGVVVAYMQPNMIGEVGEPDFYWCRKFFKWFF